MDARDLGFLAWKDPRAWMEAMKGPRWRALVAKENAGFQEAVEWAVVGDERLMGAAVAAFERAEKEGDAAVADWTAEAGTTKVCVAPRAGGSVEWSWLGDRRTQLSGDLDVAPGGLVAHTVDTGAGAQTYKVVVQRHGKVLWSYAGQSGEGGLGQAVAILGRRVYVLEAVSVLRRVRLVSLDLLTGRGRLVLYEETDPQRTVDLLKRENRGLFLMTENSGRQSLFHVVGDEMRALCPGDGISFFPVGIGASGQPCYFVRRGDFAEPWEARGAPLQAWKFSAELLRAGLDMVSLAYGVVVYRKHGERHVVQCSRRKGPSELARFFGTVTVNPWANWEGRLGAEGRLPVVVSVPGRAPAKGIISTRDRMRVEAPAAVYGGQVATGMATAEDGAESRWLVVSRGNRPTGLLVCAYGAYGAPTSLATGRWEPYLKSGWAVGFAMVRGGGDHDEAWAEAGRREGKLRGVMDLEACVRAMRGAVGMAAAETCLFGRSAGGYLVGAAIVRNPGGRLFGAAYTEVPYADVLRTASNPALPLTEYEYLEFGDPAHRVADFEAILRLSPVDGLGPNGAPGVFVVCRTAENDTQVYAYEAAKWVDALRGGKAEGFAARRREPKLLAITGGQGHFAHGGAGAMQKAEDFLILSEKILRKK